MNYLEHFSGTMRGMAQSGLVGDIIKKINTHPSQFSSSNTHVNAARFILDLEFILKTKQKLT